MGVVNQEAFDILEKYVDEHMDEILDTLRKKYLSKLTKVEDILLGTAVTYEFPKLTPTDNNKHMWYNKFNK
jgi:hypothetical protein